MSNSSSSFNTYRLKYAADMKVNRTDAYVISQSTSCSEMAGKWNCGREDLEDKEKSAVTAHASIYPYKKSGKTSRQA